MEQTQADKRALSELTLRAVLRETHRRLQYERQHRVTGFQVGEAVAWLWVPNTEANTTIPIRAIILAFDKQNRAHIRAEFRAGGVVLWVDMERLRPLRVTR